MRTTPGITLFALLAAACATAQQQGPTEEEQANARLGADAVVVLPLETLTPNPPGPPIPPALASVVWQRSRDDFNDTLRAAFALRGIGKTWVWPADLRRAHRRNPALVPDPYELSASSLRSMRLEPDADIPEALGGQLRMLLAVSEGRRYFVQPLDIALGHGNAGYTATGQVVLIDGRRQRVVWAKRVAGASAPTADGALSALAGAVASLFAESAQ